ncbi:MAG: hypothetical protein CM1200mP9_09970 [Gammaproteobacteria bacterium]|nr:MAG: hypothetical protein CM1200mP9_09970 [Gammaproteobacteria bacterium]
MRNQKTPEAVKEAIGRLEGAYAIGVMCSDEPGRISPPDWEILWSLELELANTTLHPMFWHYAR